MPAGGGHISNGGVRVFRNIYQLLEQRALEHTFHVKIPDTIPVRW